MKPQDILFIFVILILLWRKNPKYCVFAGILCLMLAIPLFQLWVFFTAERLVLYALILFLIAVLLFLFEPKK